MVCNNRGIDEFLGTSWVLITIYDGVYHNPPWSAFPSPIARQPRGCQYRTMRFRQGLGEMFPTPTVLADTIPTVEISTMKIGPGVCGVHRIVR